MLETAMQMVKDGELTDEEYDIFAKDVANNEAKSVARTLRAKNVEAQSQDRANIIMESMDKTRQKELSDKKAEVAEYYERAAADAGGSQDDQESAAKVA